MAKSQLKQYERALNDTLTELKSVSDKYEEVTENYADLARAFDNQGWERLDGVDDTLGPGLDIVRDFSKFNRSLVGINPMVKKANRIRVSYIFGEGVQFQGTTQRHTEFIEANQEFLFCDQAYQEMETAWNTDGQVFFLMDKRERSVVRVPFAEISGVATAPDSSELVYFIQRTWTERRSVGSEGQVYKPGEKRVEWYPVPELPAKIRLQAGNSMPSADTASGTVKINYDKAMLMQAVNKQVGWVWGIPDVQPVVFWAKAYKEFMEDNYKLVRALARFTWKITNQSNRGVPKTAAKLAAMPARDPLTGRVSDAGGAISLGPGNDIQAVNKAGANVNFEAGKPLAAMVAAGMEVPVDQLLALSGSNSEQKLDPPTLKAMMSRQAVVHRLLRRIFAYMFSPDQAKKIKVILPPIQSEPIHRVIQAITTAMTTNLIHVEEGRKMLLLVFRVYGIDPKEGMPEPGANAEFVAGPVNENPGTSPENPPDGEKPSTAKGKGTGKKRSPAGALSDGDHEMRKSEALSKVQAALDDLMQLDSA